MKCHFCSSPIRKKNEVCPTCSAPISAMNHLAARARFFAIVSLLLSPLPVINAPFLLLALIFILSGFVAAGRRPYHAGRDTCVIASLLLLLAIILTLIMASVYRQNYDAILLQLESWFHGTPLLLEAGAKLLSLVSFRFFFDAL